MASKERERRQFEQFCDAIGRLDLKAAADSEERDFLFGAPPELGIELADLLADQKKKGGSEIFKNERKFDPFQGQVEAEIARLHPGVGIAINLVRSDDSMGGKLALAPAVASAIALIEQALPILPVETLVTVWDIDDDRDSDGQSHNPLAAFVERLEVYKPSSQSVTQQMSTALIVGYGLDHIPDPVVDLIREKERLRAGSYVKKCSRSWLVLVATGTSGASFIDPEKFDTSKTPATGFERIYLFDQFQSRAILLFGEHGAAATA